MSVAWSLLWTCALCLLVRAPYVLLVRSYQSKPSSRRPSERSHLAVFLGSGGHTSEALTLLSGLNFSRYSPRTYIISEGDTLSARKAIALEAAKAVTHTTQSAASLEAYTILTIPRARRVHQPLYTTPFTAGRSLLMCIYDITVMPLISRTTFADVMILNGPGTCCMLGLSVIISRILGLPSPRLIYVESFARVHSLSLSGKLLRPFVDRFIVQWPGLLRDGGRGEHHGWLV